MRSFTPKSHDEDEAGDDKEDELKEPAESFEEGDEVVADVRASMGESLKA